MGYSVIICGAVFGIEIQVFMVKVVLIKNHTEKQ